MEEDEHDLYEWKVPRSDSDVACGGFVLESVSNLENSRKESCATSKDRGDWVWCRSYSAGVIQDGESLPYRIQGV